MAGLAAHTPHQPRLHKHAVCSSKSPPVSASCILLKNHTRPTHQSPNEQLVRLSHTDRRHLNTRLSLIHAGTLCALASLSLLIDAATHNPAGSENPHEQQHRHHRQLQPVTCDSCAHFCAPCANLPARCAHPAMHTLCMYHPPSRAATTLDTAPWFT